MNNPATRPEVVPTSVPVAPVADTIAKVEPATGEHQATSVEPSKS